MDMIYMRDSIAPVEPRSVLPAEPLRHAGSRPSYRFLALLLSSSGHPVSPDLPGTDRPDLLADLLDRQRRWLLGEAGSTLQEPTGP